MSTATGVATDGKQVLEFTLGDDHYCVNIDHVSEIVRRTDESITPVPDSPRPVRGVMDLRGETTTIVDPREILSIDADGETEARIIVVFDGAVIDDENVGWIVDDVNRVSSIDEDNVEPSDDDLIEGIVNRDGDFVIWLASESLRTGV